MSLVDELIRPLLEEEKKTVAVYGGGFKPPTAGHFEVVDQALKENPNIDEFIILIGGKERDGISPEESLIIWDIYKQYLPIKVEVKLSPKPPIQAVYNYAKEHPDEEVLFVIGAREGNEDDFSDIAKRTKSLDKYDNLELRTIVTQGGASGTAARNAAKISTEKLKPLLPKELKDEEVEEIFNILSNVVKENDPEDGKAAPYGSGYKKLKENNNIKYTNPNFNTEWEEAERYTEFVEMGKEEWIKIANQGAPVSYSSIKDKLGNVDLNFDGLEEPKKKRFIDAFNKGTIEMPIAVKFFDNDYDLVAGNTRLSGLVKQGVNPKIWIVDISKQTLNENASYSQHIDVMEKIAQLTNHMIDKGMNIEPLPSLEFVDGDSENAKDFFGRTAYYDPNRQHIVLYTEGRHPKDIVRSYAHEMIHHIQNLEDRLGDIAGSDTTSDDHLDKLEQEANLRGTMTFRNWTDSLNEAIVGKKIECDKCGWSWNIVDGGNDLYMCHKCGHDNEPINEKKNKDPFGINAFAIELARGLEEEEKVNYKIYSDMDGVLADFESGYEKLTGVDLKGEFVKGDDFWKPISKAGVGFWAGLKWMSDGQKLWNYIKPYKPDLLSAPSREDSSRIGKHVWVKQKLPGTKLILRYAKQKQELATPESILIDDRQINIDQWEAAGGIGILHTSADDTISQLKKLGL